MKTRPTLLALAAVALATAALAQPKAHDPVAQAAPATTAAAVLTDGEIRKVDKTAGKLTIKHGEIKNLDMPPMTMVFQVKSAALLDHVKAGDKVRFHVEKAASGYVVTTIERAP